MNFTRSIFVVTALLGLAAPRAFAQSERYARLKMPAFQADILAKMNEYRVRHGAPPLRMTPALNQYAEERVNTVSEKDGLAAGHAGLKPGHGENLFWGWSGSTSTYSASMAVDSWYGEQKEYKGVASSSTENFAQLIWKNTTEVGCARVARQGSSYFSTWIVCVFTPPGNQAGLFAANVLPVVTTPPVVKKSLLSDRRSSRK